MRAATEAKRRRRPHLYAARVQFRAFSKEMGEPSLATPLLNFQCRTKLGCRARAVIIGISQRLGYLSAR